MDKDIIMDKHINVVLASDDNYAQHVAVVTVSILKNTKFADQLHFFVLSDDLKLIGPARMALMTRRLF